MAETFIALGASLFGGGGGAAAAGTASAGAAAGGGGLFASASGLSTVFTIGSALSSIMQGFAQARALEVTALSQESEAFGFEEQAAVAGAQNAQAKARDAQERASMAAEYADIVAEQQAVQVANGLNPSVGTPQSIREATTKQADQNLGVSRENTRNASYTRRMQQRSLMRKAQTSRTNAASTRSSKGAAVLGGLVGGLQAGLQGYRMVGS